MIWEPSSDVIAKSRLKRFMDQHGIATFPELLRRADEDIEWFWDAAIKDVDIACTVTTTAWSTSRRASPGPSGRSAGA